MRPLVLGLGNELAGDDAVGLLAARAVRAELERRGEELLADVLVSSASGLALIELLADRERAVILDAIRTGSRPPGAIVELDLGAVGRIVAPSAHQAGPAELAAVARALGLGFPRTTRVMAVEVAGPLVLGAPLSPPVAAAIPELAERTVAILRRWAREAGPTRETRGGRPCTTTTPSRS